MSNKSRLQTNNTNLQALIDKANSLPDADSGGSSGSSIITIHITGYLDNYSYAAYYSESGEMVFVTSPATIHAIAGIVMTYNNMGGSSASGVYVSGNVGYNKQYRFL